MKPLPIGILGGAGPLAGAQLLERVFSLSTQLYGCCRDSDFPQVILLSFPFSEMLTPQRDLSLLRQELRASLAQLRRNGAQVLAIACNTLHAFLDEHENLSDLVHLPQGVASAIPSHELPLVLCTSTSIQFGVHRQFFPCRYPEAHVQCEIDHLIDLILKGWDQSLILHQLQRLLKTQKERVVVLGCTELSLFTRYLAIENKLIIDPLEITAKKLLEVSFNQKLGV